MTATGLVVAARKVLPPVVFGLVPLAAVVLFVAGTAGTRTFLFDFHGDLYAAGAAILHGRDPYRASFLAHLAALERAGARPTTIFAVPVYPAPDLVASALLALIPYTLAGLAFTAAGVAALVLALRLLGVRDPRCYGATFLSWPVLHSLRLGQVNELLVLGLALIWRYRTRIIAPALAIAATITAKLFLWPVALSLLFQRRYRTAAVAFAAAAGGTLAAWATIGFDGLTTYPRMLGNLSAVEGAAGISFASLSVALGGSRAVGNAVGLAAAAVLIGIAWALARVKAPAASAASGGSGPPARRDHDGRAFALLVIAGLTASPLVWPHYLTLLLVPIALLSPAFGPLWLVPLLAWAAPTELTHGNAGEIVVYLTIELIVASAAAAPQCRRVFSGSSRAFAKALGAGGTPVRLGAGLESTSSRSYIAAQRPNKGPEEPHYTQVEDLMPRTANRPT